MVLLNVEQILSPINLPKVLLIFTKCCLTSVLRSHTNAAFIFKHNCTEFTRLKHCVRRLHRLIILVWKNGWVKCCDASGGCVLLYRYSYVFEILFICKHHLR